MGPSRVTKVVVVTTVGLIGVVVIVFAAVTFAMGVTPEWTSVEELCSRPEKFSYEPNSEYSVFIRKPSISISLSPGPSYAVVGTTGSGGDLGVWVELNPSNDSAGMTCTWTADGVDIAESTGIVHSIPAGVFIGGR
ncbi:MAG TPA: hypothetical protein VL068_02835 [Microthrixaceae bacterium]|nr:hypothetical protein [Microthrixaceae bacterium]